MPNEEYKPLEVITNKCVSQIHMIKKLYMEVFALKIKVRHLEEQLKQKQDANSNTNL